MFNKETFLLGDLKVKANEGFLKMFLIGPNWPV